MVSEALRFEKQFSVEERTHFTEFRISQLLSVAFVKVGFPEFDLLWVALAFEFLRRDSKKSLASLLFFSGITKMLTFWVEIYFETEIFLGIKEAIGTKEVLLLHIGVEYVLIF